jgi:hypothetical protein
VRPENEDRSDETLRRDNGCTESLPVPCFGKCSATFVHCLRELYERKLMGETLELPEQKEESSDRTLLASPRRRTRKRKIKDETPKKKAKKFRRSKHIQRME